MSLATRYSAQLIIPDQSDVPDKLTNQELTYVFSALRTLAIHIDNLTGGLSPLEADWAAYAPDGAYASTNAHKIYALCGSNIAYGAMVNFYNDAGVLKARPAQASGAALVAGGFCNNPGGFTAGTYGEFYCGPGINYGIAGMTPGTWYFLDPTTATGQVTAVPPVAAGQAFQIVGQAVAENKLLCGAFNNWYII